MKIVLIRHIKSDWSIETSDFERPILNERKHELKKVIAFLKKKHQT